MNDLGHFVFQEGQLVLQVKHDLGLVFWDIFPLNRSVFLAWLVGLGQLAFEAVQFLVFWFGGLFGFWLADELVVDLGGIALVLHLYKCCISMFINL